MSLRSDCLLATTGIFPREITPQMHAASTTVPETFGRRLRSWLTSDEPKPFDYKPPPDMDRMWQKLAVPPAELDVQAWITGLGVDEPELVGEYFSSLTAARKYVTDAWPQLTLMTLAGPKLLPLSRDDAEEMWSLIQVLDDPERVIGEMYSRTLTTTQAAAFRACYPDLAALADQAITEAMVEKVARKREWEPTREQEAMLNTFAGDAPEEPVRMPPPAPPAPPPKVESAADRERTQAEISAAPKNPNSSGK